MQQQVDSHVFTGMQRDLSISKHPANYLYDAQNIRITAREDNTLLSITNERGPKDLEIEVTGSYLGHCILNQYLIIFSTTSRDDNYTGKDYITRINLENIDDVSGAQVTELYNSSRGNLHFSPLHPIEAIASYENGNIQKVYWTDGNNQPRMINICEDKEYNANSFEFVPKLKLNEHVKVTKLVGSGEFPPGVIQYAFTYFNKYKQESNIFYVTPLQYISYIGRAGSPEEKVANSFKISLSNLDTENFEFLRIYSILRTSINGTPIVKRVQDIKLLDNRTISEEVETHSTWYYQYFENSKLEVSTDSGLSFSLDLSPFAVDPATNVPIDPDGDGVSNRDTSLNWSSAIVNGANRAVYKFDKTTYPDLVIKLNGYYYTWSGGVDGDTTSIYVGTSDAYGGYRVFVGETGETFSKMASPILRTNKIQVGEDIIVGVTFIDDGTQGDDIDPTELLYKGGEVIKANTIAQKDGTMFLGGLSITRDHPNIKDALLKHTGILSSEGEVQTCLANGKVTSVLKNRPYTLASKAPFSHIDTLNCPAEENYLGASFFKSKEYYRLGVQFQHESGKWSEPYWIGDKQGSVTPVFDESGNNKNYVTKGIGVIAVPEYSYTLDSSDILKSLSSAGYKRARAVFAVPSNRDRTILCQGVLCPSLYRMVDRHSNAKKDPNSDWAWKGDDNLGTIYAQSSWIFRPFTTTNQFSTGGGGVQSQGKLWSHFDDEKNTEGAMNNNLASTEVMGIYDDGHCFYADRQFVTFHSPDVMFDDSFSHMNFTGCYLSNIGTVRLGSTYGDISIQTSTPPIGSTSGGFVHKAIKTSGETALITGLFYNDYLVNDVDGNNYSAWKTSGHPPVDWPVFLWHKNGSLNNDVNRNGRSAELLKKKISNYRQGDATTYFSEVENFSTYGIGLFNSDQLTMIKVNGHPYRGNIETMVTPTTPSPFYIVGNPFRTTVNTDFTSQPYYKLALLFPLNESSPGGLWYYNASASRWEQAQDPDADIWDTFKGFEVGRHVKGLRQWKEGVSIKYKSTPHLAIDIHSDNDWVINAGRGCLALAEVRRAYNENTMFGGFTEDALEAATWIPCGPVVNLNTSKVVIEFKWGDTYMQRFECLKTYPFTQEDKNQVIDIASFMCETRVNIDGRYDRNRGQASNLNVSPTNFNLLNPVYNQLDNFFNYRILDDDYYKISSFPNQITWTKEKHSGADIDLWTNITLASTYDMDGSKGQIQSLNTWEDQIYCFQDKGISNILFNSRVQVAASDGVPIEISNSYKVDGYRYISDGTGCSNKQTIKETPTGIYFIDSVTNNLYHIGEGISDISTTHNMSTWFQYNEIRRTVYDDVHHDLYVDNGVETLCYSEVLKEFTSRMSYGGIEYLESYGSRVFTSCENKLYEFGKGTYNIYFNRIFQPWYLNFISNGVSNQANNSTLDKVFENLEFRMDRYSYNKIDNIWENKHDKSLDYIHVYNEYQDSGLVDLKTVLDRPSNLKKKFRIWRANIPRHLNVIYYNEDEREAMLLKLQQTNPDATLEDIPTERYQRRDRIRNTWCNIELGIKNHNIDKVELHDMNVYYYI